MKKQLLLLCIIITSVFTLVPLSRTCQIKQPLRKNLDEKYETAMNKLQIHLEVTNLTPTERNDLINKLVGYFSPPEKISIFLKNPQAQLIYGTVTKSYHEIKTAQSSSSEKNLDMAKKFGEQALGKILLFKKPIRQKNNKPKQ